MIQLKLILIFQICLISLCDCAIIKFHIRKLTKMKNGAIPLNKEVFINWPDGLLNLAREYQRNNKTSAIFFKSPKTQVVVTTGNINGSEILKKSLATSNNNQTVKKPLRIHILKILKSINKEKNQTASKPESSDSPLTRKLKELSKHVVQDDKDEDKSNDNATKSGSGSLNEQVIKIHFSNEETEASGTEPRTSVEATGGKKDDNNTLSLEDYKIITENGVPLTSNKEFSDFIPDDFTSEDLPTEPVIELKDEPDITSPEAKILPSETSKSDLIVSIIMSTTTFILLVLLLVAIASHRKMKNSRDCLLHIEDRSNTNKHGPYLKTEGNRPARDIGNWIKGKITVLKE